MKKMCFSKLPIISPSALKAIKKGIHEKHAVSELEALGVSQRLINLLETNDINNLEQLMQKKKEDLLEISNFGEKQLFVLFEALSKYNEIYSEV